MHELGQAAPTGDVPMSDGWDDAQNIDRLSACAGLCQAQAASDADPRGESARAGRWRDYANRLSKALELAWDGNWYRRGYYDDGTPLGSRKNDDSRIFRIAQSWSVLAGSGNETHAAEAMAAADRMLVDRPHRLVRLFTPPFDRGTENPGYICVASAASGQKASVKMRDFELLRVACRRSEVYEQRRTSAIYG